jgi:8-oxo-dGTP pyrophosphatase MutT (NUDIX family)
MIKEIFDQYQHSNKEVRYSILIDQLNKNEDLSDRSNMRGHVTCSFMLFNKNNTQILMIDHIHLNKWLVPGGHYEGGSLIENAIRELEEETGYNGEIDILSYIPVDIDTHIIPARPSKNEGEHYHHDFLFWGVAKDDVTLNHQIEEVSGCRWVDIADVPHIRYQNALSKITLDGE